MTIPGGRNHLTGPLCPRRRRGRPAAPSSRCGLLVLLGAALLMLLACATVELAAVAFASGQRAKAASGLLLVAWGAGSFLGGLLLGSRARRLPLGLLCWISAASFALLCVAASAAELAALLFCSGMTLAPMLSRLYGLVGERAIGGRSSEVFGWLTGALAVGAAAGTALGGEVVDRLRRAPGVPARSGARRGGRGARAHARTEPGGMAGRGRRRCSDARVIAHTHLVDGVSSVDQTSRRRSSVAISRHPHSPDRRCFRHAGRRRGTVAPVMVRSSRRCRKRRAVERTAYAACSCSPAGSKARRMVAALFWMRSQDALIPVIARSPSPAQVAT